MIRIIDKPPIKFEKIIKETIENNLRKYKFSFDGDFPLTPEQDSDVIFSRSRQGISEIIGFNRKLYSDNYDTDCNDEAEKKVWGVNSYDKNQNRFSRHLFEVKLVVNGGHQNLLTTGKPGIGRNGEEYWYFEDEEDLRKLLAEKITPLLQTVAMKDFDEQLENELEYLSKKKERQIAEVPSQIAFVKKEKGYEAFITEITEENVEIDYLKKVFKKGKKISEADEEYGHLVSKFTYRVITNNSQLVKAIETHSTFKQEFPDLIIIFEGEWK